MTFQTENEMEYNENFNGVNLLNFLSIIDDGQKFIVYRIVEECRKEHYANILDDDCDCDDCSGSDFCQYIEPIGEEHLEELISSFEREKFEMEIYREYLKFYRVVGIHASNNIMKIEVRYIADNPIYDSIKPVHQKEFATNPNES